LQVVVVFAPFVVGCRRRQYTLSGGVLVWICVLVTEFNARMRVNNRSLAAEFWQIYRPAAHLNPALYFAQRKVILVISALPQEDKTTVSTN
jgi:Mrp family chromosome partitioning ATPase